mmetsp:Transcript_4695/g.11391  ORF Transcript_4695/g.11391 Transcript_4695/m.11391 type:complete len:115 (-) Transcript_4695:731-1075(-)
MSSQRFSRCQVSGCGKPVSENLPKRKLLTCSEHRRALVVDVNGVKSRFCQQCTRMHPLHEFDGAKRGCRKRLKQRNLRRQTSNNLTRQACETTWNDSCEAGTWRYPQSRTWKWS